MTFPARAVVDLAAVRANTAALADRAAGGAQVMAVVKADAYGHGLVPCARAALAGGATWLGVAQIDEALELRAAGVTAPLLVWLFRPGEDLAPAVAAGVDLAVAAPWALAAVVSAARTSGYPARIHLKIDTGLGRGGVAQADVEDLVRAAVAEQATGALEVVGVYSHFAYADAPDHPTVRAQAEVFADVVDLVERTGAHLEVRHLANSAALLTNPSVHWDLVRPGLALYGLSPLPFAGPAEFSLVPAMRLESELLLTKRVPAGHGVSYGHVYRTERETVLGLIGLGYADGIPRHASGTATGPGAPLQVGGRRLGIAGRVCMDQFVVDLGPDASEQAGDQVVLFGAGTDGEPTAEDWAAAAGTISYEIVARLGCRVPREYVGGEA